MIALPIDPALPEILASLKAARRLVLVAPPGSGKTTRVAPSLARSGLLRPSHPAVVLLQPRRVAARASAARIAEENGWRLGEEVGYQIRGERRIGRRTIVRVATEGVLTRQLLADPFLDGVGAVILDEFHERSLHTDLALALLQEARTVRDDLILVVMSATLDADPIAAFLDSAPIVRVEGRSFPVAVTYVPFADKTPLHDRVAATVARSFESGRMPGDTLVFLPGVEEIRRAGRAVSAIADGHLILPLHGSLPAEEQDRALRPADRPKLILSTNVAETSLTIDGVTTVIDSGLARVARHDPARGLDRLELSKISRASAVQRAGRAGRTAPGRCLRMWAEREDRGRPEFEEPEVRRVDLAATVLTLKAWGHNVPSSFGWFERPTAESLDRAERLLTDLGAIEAPGGPLTDIGRTLLTLPVHPRLGRLIAGAAALGRLADGADLAAILSEKDLLVRSESGRSREAPSRRGDSDLLTRLDALDEARRSRFSPSLRSRGIDPLAARRVAETAHDLLRVGRSLSNGSSDVSDASDLFFLPLLAYPDRVCRRRTADPSAATMVGGRGVRLEPESIVREAEFFLAIDPRDGKFGGKREARVKIASALDPSWLDDLFPGAVRRERVVRYDESRGRAVAFDSVVYRDLTLREETHGAVSGEEASRALAEWLATRAVPFLRENEAAAKWLDRLEFLRKSLPELDWPELAEDTLAEVIGSACSGKKTLEEARRVPLVPLLKGLMTFEQSRTMDAEAPETIEVPTGNRIRLEYEPGRPPVLAVRLQELFGVAETPRVARGRVPVLLHLLGPNHRPVQITEDLRSFWTTTYFQVRKDLRSRYPRHSWPDDPWTARPVAKGRRG